MPKKTDDKLEKRCIIAKDWKFSGDLIVDFVLTRIEGFRRKGKWKHNFDEEELVKRFVDVVCCIGVGFEEYLGRFGKDYFFHILDNWTMMGIDEEIKYRRKFSKKKKNLNKKGGEK